MGVRIRVRVRVRVRVLAWVIPFGNLVVPIMPPASSPKVIP